MISMNCRPPYLPYIPHILSTYLCYLWSIGQYLYLLQHWRRNTKSFSTLFYRISDLLTTLRIYNYNYYYYKIAVLLETNKLKEQGIIKIIWRFLSQQILWAYSIYDPFDALRILTDTRYSYRIGFRWRIHRFEQTISSFPRQFFLFYRVIYW
jgi:hypothetical protein